MHVWRSPTQYTYEVIIRFPARSLYSIVNTILKCILFHKHFLNFFRSSYILLVQKFNNNIEQRQNQKQYSTHIRLGQKPFSKVIVCVSIAVKSE